MGAGPWGHRRNLWLPGSGGTGSAVLIALAKVTPQHAWQQPIMLIMAPPRTGKTGLLARLILRCPGPVVSTTTKLTAFDPTSGIRARRGPVHVFNPQDIGGVPSTFRWNPLEGCADEAVAIRRADAFANAVSLSGTEDASFWSAKASSYLRGLFHAAALAGAPPRHRRRRAHPGTRPATQADQTPDVACARGVARAGTAARPGPRRGKCPCCSRQLPVELGRWTNPTPSPPRCCACRSTQEG
jgi:type IV secretory pathway TraG/TraD family ATPase VirD4